jgi:hypothetical protein
MANPYHDGDGKFCSRGEMQAAIHHLVQEQRYDEAQVLIADIKSIDEKAGLNQFNEEFGQGRNTETLRYAAGLIENHAKGRHELQNASDEQIEGVAKVLRYEKKVHLITVHNPAQEELSDLEAEVKEKTGIGGYDELKRHVASENMRLETEGLSISKEIQEEAEAQGLPARYSGYYFKKLNTEIGLTPTFNNDYNRGNVYRPFITPPISAETYPVKVQNKEQRAIIQNAVNTVFNRDDIKSKTEDFNSGLISLAHKNEVVAEYRHSIDGQALRKRSDIAHKARQLHNASIVADNAVAWRKQIREAGVKTNSAAPRSLSALKGTDITADENGHVSNMWAVNVNSETSDRSLDKIAAVIPARNEYSGATLMGESGQEYAAGTHYANYKTTHTETSLIVDSTIKGAKSFAGVKTFKTIVDSGD